MRRAIEKKIDLVVKVFCAHEYLTDLIGPFGHIRSANELRRIKSRCEHTSSSN